MKQNAFYDIFVEQLRILFDCENQLVSYLPKVIQATSNLELKESLIQHLDETNTQVLRLKDIFKMLNENPTGEISKGIRGLIEECDQVINRQRSSVAKDAYLIVCCQKIEHYEIAAYGSARAIANHLNHAINNNNLDFDKIANDLQMTLDEEGEADAILTKVAEGGFFTEGVNDAAEKEEAFYDDQK